MFSFCVFSLKAQKKSATPLSGGTSIVDYFPPQPEFPGGQKAYYKFLKKNLKWPSQDDVQGKVFISFTVEKDGRLTNFKVDRKLSPAFDNEALRVLKLSPRWKPAMQNSKPIKCRYTVPINFALGSN